VQLSGYFFADPISPHLAARLSGQRIEVDPIVAAIRPLLDPTDLVVVELAGGLFTPLGDDLVNADLALALRPDRVLLVAPDRLGVLHDVIATLRAAATVPLPVDGLVLTPPSQADASTGRNALELLQLTSIQSITSVRQAPSDDLANDAALVDLARSLVQ
jgi:dethiobiotin synthetase